MKTVHSHLIKDTALGAPLGTFWTAVGIGGAFLLAGSVLLIGPAPGVPHAMAIGLTAYLLGAIWAAGRLSTDFPFSTLGLCNIATLARLVIVGILFVALLAGVSPSWATFGLACVALGLDGIDGWLARKQGLASDFGARFDVEVDAAFALVLAVFAAAHGAAGFYVVLLGLPYYAFGAAKLVWPWLSHPLPEKFSRKVVCVFQIAALIALQVPFLADGRLDLVILAVTTALIWSFGRDILWLWRNAK